MSLDSRLTTALAERDEAWTRANEAARLSADARDRADALNKVIADLREQIATQDENHLQLLGERDEARAEVVRLGKENEEHRRTIRSRQTACDEGHLAGDRLRAALEEERIEKPEAASGLCETGTDGVLCIVTDEQHRAAYHGGFPAGRWPTSLVPVGVRDDPALQDYRKYADPTTCPECCETLGGDECACDWGAIAAREQHCSPVIHIDLRGQ